MQEYKKDCSWREAPKGPEWDNWSWRLLGRELRAIKFEKPVAGVVLGAVGLVGRPRSPEPTDTYAVVWSRDESHDFDLHDVHFVRYKDLEPLVTDRFIDHAVVEPFVRFVLLPMQQKGWQPLSKAERAAASAAVAKAYEAVGSPEGSEVSEEEEWEQEERVEVGACSRYATVMWGKDSDQEEEAEVSEGPGEVEESSEDDASELEAGGDGAVGGGASAQSESASAGSGAAAAGTGAGAAGANTGAVSSVSPACTSANAIVGLTGRLYPKERCYQPGDRLVADYRDNHFDEDAEFVVSWIVDDATFGRQRWLLVKWQGYELELGGKGHCGGWEPVKALVETAALEQWDKRKPQYFNAVSTKKAHTAFSKYAETWPR